jgi:hypothetical protein
LDEEFLTIRAKVLEVAAALDRLDRAEGQTAGDPRRDGLADAVELLLSAEPDRAERVQLLFSRDFDPDWRDKMGMPQEKEG